MTEPARKKRRLAPVSDLETARRQRGRPSGLGYDPATGKEYASPTYVEDVSKESDTEVDVFTLVDKRGYSEERFYTRSLNTHNHGEKIQLKMPLGIDSQVYAAVSEIAQYRSVQDLFRDALVHRLEFLQKRYSLGDGMRRMLELERVQADREARAQEAEIMQGSVEDLMVKLQGLWDKEDWGLMAVELEEGGESVDWLREPYKSRAQKVLDDWRARARVKIAEAQEASE